jgi:DNA-binding transcriptional LysR family regulator
LEKALGLNLFDRKGKSLQPNTTGRRVALATQTFFGALDDVMDVAQARAETIRLGAGEAMLRWFVMPHLAELMAGDPPLRFDVYNLTTESAVREILAGGVDLVIMRTDAVPDALQSEVVKTVQYILTVPRTLLRSREGAEVFEGRPLPFAELAGDGFFTRTVQTTAKALGLNLRPVLQAQTFSLLISAVESGTAAAFLPEIAAKSLPEQNFALVSAEGMGALSRRLSLVWSSQVLESRPAVRRAITRLRRVLS